MRSTAAEADQDAGSPGPHQVQSSRIGGDTADHNRNIQLVDELLEVERLGLARYMLGRHGRAADDKQVDTGVDDGLPELLGPLWRQRSRGDDTRLAYLVDALDDQVF